MHNEIPQFFTRILYTVNPDGVLQLHFVYEPPKSDFVHPMPQTVATVVTTVRVLPNMIAKLSAILQSFEKGQPQEKSQ